MSINLTTYINQLGFGLVGLNVLLALSRQGHDPALWVNGPGEAPQEDHPTIEAALAGAASFDPHAPSLRIAHPWDFAHRVGRGPHAGLTFFEADRLPPRDVHNLSSLDIVFCPSAWATHVLQGHGIPAGRLVHCPPGVDAGIFHGGVAPAPSLAGLGGPGGKTVFLNCGKWEVRKGHDVLADAFCKAFGPGDDVLLVMNCSNPFLPAGEQARWERLYLDCPLGERVVVVPHRLRSQREVAALMAAADCGVFPSRAEGWNLEALEMMAMGKHVIATDCTAHRDFCTAENSLPVGVTATEPAYDGIFFKDPQGEGRWAEMGPAQVEQLVAHMRAVHRRKREGSLRANDAGLATAAKLTWDRAAGTIMGALHGPRRGALHDPRVGGHPCPPEGAPL